ncbi:ABC transporter permease [Synoicihabitans lomoniglobus]|uniref:ABC transporter permease subunit n=1 Tax=Synoicihabitans lomoniglobus TaxID=2909285 RepID=A0AAE9ZSR8_9BACT|nr:ABC transporter permease subunit [Opitutaceae bacterium LMO-M01]WED63586.1 ABC transporter permease subunit [Opitutaceae bacterium LMO-M01]
MRHFLTILGHEIRMLLVSPSTYIAAVIFLAFMGFIFSGILAEYATLPQDNSPAVSFFELFWVPVIFIVPLLTMKSISEERRLGTLETLLTTPISTAEVVLGKYGAAYFLYLSLWSATAGFFYILHRFTNDAFLLDLGPLIGGYLFIAVSGLFFVAIGIFASSLSRNQAVAGIFGVTMLFGLIIGTQLLAGVAALNLDLFTPVKSAVEYARVFTHLDDFSRGIVDTRQLLFYISGTTLTLIFSILGLEAKLLHS